MNKFLPDTEVGLEKKEWRKLIDAYLFQKPYDYEAVIGRLDERQEWCLNEIKKSRKRNQ